MLYDPAEMFLFVVDDTEILLNCFFLQNRKKITQKYWKQKYLSYLNKREVGNFACVGCKGFMKNPLVTSYSCWKRTVDINEAIWPGHVGRAKGPDI